MSPQKSFAIPLFAVIILFYTSIAMAHILGIDKKAPQKGMVVKKEWRLVVEYNGTQTSYEVSPAYFSRVSLGDSVDFSLGVPVK